MDRPAEGLLCGSCHNDVLVAKGNMKRAAQQKQICFFVGFIKQMCCNLGGAGTGTAGMGFPAATFNDAYLYGVAIDYAGEIDFGFLRDGFVGLKKSTDAINVEGSKTALIRCLVLGAIRKALSR